MRNPGGNDALCSDKDVGFGIAWGHSWCKLVSWHLVGRTSFGLVDFGMAVDVRRWLGSSKEDMPNDCPNGFAV